MQRLLISSKKVFATFLILTQASESYLHVGCCVCLRCAKTMHYSECKKMVDLLCWTGTIQCVLNKYMLEKFEFLPECYKHKNQANVTISFAIFVLNILLLYNLRFMHKKKIPGQISRFKYLEYLSNEQIFLFYFPDKEMTCLFVLFAQLLHKAHLAFAS